MPKRRRRGTNMSELFLGSHLDLKAPDYYLGTVKTALEYGENTFMFYTGAPQNTIRRPVSQMKIEEGRALLKENGIDESKIVIHAPYIINLGNKGKQETYDLAKSFLITELQRTQAFHVKNLVLHPGSHLQNGEEFGLASLVEGLDYVFSVDGTDVTVCLETMAGKGSEIGTSFEFLAKVIASLRHPERIGITLDTCHINDAGYDVKDIDALLEHFDRTIGLDKLKVIHLNDSKNERGSHKDRHENLGYGTIGFDALLAFVNHPKLDGIPKILETPYVNHEKAPYKKEIAMLKEGVYDPSWRENL